jgi:hypothetical protein
MVVPWPTFTADRCPAMVVFSICTHVLNRGAFRVCSHLE